MTPCNPGDIVLVRFPFTDLTSTKKRPALVISPSQYPMQSGDIIVMALTSQPQGTELALRGWKIAGLPKPTWFKPIVATLSMSVVTRRLGVLAEGDWEDATRVISTLIAEQFRKSIS